LFETKFKRSECRWRGSRNFARDILVSAIRKSWNLSANALRPEVEQTKIIDSELFLSEVLSEMISSDGKIEKTVGIIVFQPKALKIPMA